MHSAGSLPRQLARTRHFTLGAPRSFTATERFVLFLRSKGGDDPVTCLWRLDLDSGRESLLADPRSILGADASGPTREEQARRERAREMAEGIVSYALDEAPSVAAFSLGGSVFVVRLEGGEVTALETAERPFDPRPDPSGRRVGYVASGALHVVGRDEPDRTLMAEDDPDVTWGLAEFIAAEEMRRARGYWWAPDGSALAAARVDVGPVVRWHIADPADPEAEPVTVAYPAAGTSNAQVTLAVVGLDGSKVDVEWDRRALPYLVDVSWSRDAPLTLTAQPRDQRALVVLAADPASGATRVVAEQRDAHWVEILPGAPAWLEDGRLLFYTDSADTRRLTVQGEPITPPGLQVSEVLHAGRSVVFAATEDPTEMHLWRWAPGGEIERLTESPGIHGGAAGEDCVVVASSSMQRFGAEVTVRPDAGPARPIASHSERPVTEPEVSFLTLGSRSLQCALLLPRSSDESLPVLLDPYGGPHHLSVVRARNRFLEAQWFADQGFAVLVCDGRGTPGRGPSWERSIHADLAATVLEDQIDALTAAADSHSRLDLERVGIRGWSFGGFLAALAVLRRPDVFHAAVAGAPVTDWRLYDTHYTERYLGLPAENAAAYERISLLNEADSLTRPLLLIHGLADDNVLVAHTLLLSRALLEAGRQHNVLPLSRVTHFTPDEAVSENLLLFQLRFLRQALGLE